MNQFELVTQIGRLEARLPNAVARIRQDEKDVSSAKVGRIGGAALLLIAVVGLGLLFSWWPVWAVVGALGALKLVSAIAKLSRATKEMNEQQSWVTQSRSKVDEWRALFTAAQGFPSTLSTGPGPLQA